MADNVAVTPGSGATLAADDIGGVLYGRTKIVIGDDGVNGGDVSASNPMPVTGALTDTQLRATAVPVSGTFWQATQPVSAASLPLPTGAATEATLSTMNGKLPSPGQALMAASQPVVIASNQTAIPTVETATVYTGAAAQTAVVNNILESVSGSAGTACENFRAASVQVVSTGSGGTFIFEQSNDNTNWIALPVFNAALVTAVPITAAITATASQIIYTFPVRARFVRLRIATLITGGSIQAFTRFSSDPWVPAAFLVASNVAANLAATVSGTVTANIGTGSIAAGTNAIGDVGQQYRASATGGASFVAVMSPATPAATVCKASAGRLLGFQLQNSSAAIRSVKFWNTAQGSVTLGTTAALFEVDIPAGGRAEFTLEGGIAFATAITYAVTGAKGLTDNTGTLGVNDVSGALYFA